MKIFVLYMRNASFIFIIIIIIIVVVVVIKCHSTLRCHKMYF